MTSESVRQHRREAHSSIRCTVITVSDTRNLETDRGGKTVIDLLESAGHQVMDRFIVPDEPDRITEVVRQSTASTQAVLLTGGTGISARDNTYEAVSCLFDRIVPGYGELFRMLSYQEIGAAAMLSRTIGGVVGQTIVLTMPGSTAAVQLAMDRLILPELAHLVHEATK